MCYTQLTLYFSLDNSLIVVCCFFSIRRLLTPWMTTVLEKIHQGQLSCLRVTWRHWLSLKYYKQNLLFFIIELFRYQGRKKMFYLTMHSTRFIYGYMASNIWLRTILIVRKETRCRHMGYSFQLTARVLLYAPSHRQDCTYHGLCYTCRGALAGTRNSSMGPPHEGSIRRPIAPWAYALTTELHLAPWDINVFTSSLVFN